MKLFYSGLYPCTCAKAITDRLEVRLMPRHKLVKFNSVFILATHTHIDKQ